jgi:hypothetical protein
MLEPAGNSIPRVTLGRPGRGRHADELENTLEFAGALRRATQALKDFLT